MATSQSSEEFWLFGYGSLIWKPPPHFDRRIPGYVRGYVRRFWQASEDHRGTPEAPGRVVTLLAQEFWKTLADPHAAGDKVWGCAYRIEAAHVDEVKAYLDIREINGYTIHYTPFYPVTTEARGDGEGVGEQTIKCMVYIGTPDNEQFTGVQDVQQLAEHIYRSVGPSGLNKEYLLGLDEALRELGSESGDVHVEDLAKRVREIERMENGKDRNEVTDEVKKGHEDGLEENLEEVEKTH